MAVELGAAYISLLPSTSKFVPEFNKTIGSAQGAASSGGKGLGGVMFGALAGVGMSLMNKAISTISNSMGAAISRVDTLNAFPKVMANLGYSADDAEASITKMSDKLAGLPTSLDTMAGAVQVMAPLTASLEEATDISLALNNALIAGGKSTTEQSNAMEQYVQMLAVGKVDMQAWRSMVSAMPGQMDQLSKSLLGADAKQTDLYEAMQDGTVTFDDFNQELLKLNDTGLEGFASFQKQALDATGGIGTSLANLKTAITRNLANVLQQVQPQIDAVIAGLTNFANAAGPAFIGVVEGIGATAQWVGDNWAWIGPLVVGIGTAVAVFGAWTGAIALWTKITTIAKAVQLAFNTALIANPIGLIVAAIAALVAGLVYFFTQTELGQKIWGEFTQFLQEAWANITSFLSTTWANITSWFTAFGNSISNVWNNTWNAVTNAVQSAIQFVQKVIQVGILAAQIMWQTVWNAVRNFFTNVWNAIVSAATGFMNSVKNTFTSVTNFIGSIPSKIMGFFRGIGTWLLDSGKALIQGFINGIKSAFEGAKKIVSDGLGAIRNLFPFSPAKEGPFSGRGWVDRAGVSLGATFTQSIADSLHDGRKEIHDELGGIRDEFAGMDGGMSAGFRLSAASPVGSASGSSFPRSVVLSVGGREFEAYLYEKVSDVSHSGSKGALNNVLGTV